MARKTITMGRNPRRKPSSFGSDFPSVETEEGSGRALAKKPPSVKTGEPSGGPLAKRGSTEVSKEGRPSMGVDGRQKRLTGEKVVEGKTIRDAKQALPAPEKPTTTKPQRGPTGNTLSGAAGVAGAARGRYAPEPGGFSRSIAEGTLAGGLPGAVAGGIGYLGGRASNYKRDPRLKTWADDKESFLPTAKPKQESAAPKPSAPASKPSAPASKSSAPTPKASAPAPKPKAKPASAKSKSSAEYDDWLADLRGSAARMKAETSRAAEKTGAMKEKASAFSQSFKKGGSVKSRGDGIAQRGRTKGRFV